MTEKVWGGRFHKGPDEILNLFNASLPFDKRLYAQDIDGSMAHCRMLAKQGIISADEAAQILEKLKEIREEMDRGEFLFDEAFEDIHSLVEKTLVKRAGPVGEKLHTARSRNDQVSLDLRMYMKEAIRRLESLIHDMQRVLVRRAEEEVEVIMPGYTHLQRAQPVLLAHHLLAYYEMLKRDRERFRENYRRVNVLPLGSAALAGSTFDLDREMVARELGFEKISENSMDAVSDRDFVAEFLFASSLLIMHLSRLSEEIVIWSSQEFGFATLPDELCTGSSIMPQKKNPDIPELVRGKTGRVYGHLVGLLTTMKGLPLTYNKDLQEDKEAFFDTMDTMEQCLAVMTRLLESMTFNKESMREGVEQGYLAATDLADYLARKGLPFRQAHEKVGKMVLYAMQGKKELRELTLEEMKKFSELIEKDVYQWLEPLHCVKRRELPGGTGPGAVRRQIEQARRELGI
ncbi:MAG: argininosuccinate lyase [Deltaproteobacteria bacterium HGW-Deltaproteobacteria-21]|nr:MAG: argininosuccinate lyase [Deltaproteobacteria bacterium HGW-Deltaproteobacteria-21]